MISKKAGAAKHAKTLPQPGTQAVNPAVAAALQACRTTTTNDGSHITAQQQARIDAARKTTR